LGRLFIYGCLYSSWTNPFYKNVLVHLYEWHNLLLLNDAKGMLMESHKKVMALIDTFSNDELFAKNTYQNK